MFLGGEHLHYEANGATGGEVLATIPTQVGAHDFLVGRALGIDIGAAKVIACQLGNDEGERPVGQGDFFVALEQAVVLLLDGLEKRLDALADLLTASRVEGLERTYPELPRFVGLLFVIHLAEDEIQKLPERSVLGHAFIAVDVVVAAPEGDAQHFRLGTAQAPHGTAFDAEGVITQGPVTDGLELGVEAGDFLLEEEKFQAISPQAVVAAIDFGHHGFEQLKLFARLFRVTHAVSALGADLGLFLDHNGAVEVVFGVRLPWLEDGNINLAVLAVQLDLEVRLHVFGGNAVFMNDGAGNALTHPLLVGFFDLLASDVVKDLTLFERTLGRLGF